MLEAFKTFALTTMLMAWSAIAVAQTPPSGTPGTTPPAASGTTLGAETNWLWIIALIAVVAVLLFYFLRRNHSTRI